jgi:hypothetical protein
MGDIVSDYRLCVDAAIGIFAEKFDGLDLDPAAVQSMAATLYINWSYTKFHKPLFEGMVEPSDDESEAESELLTEIKDLIAPLTKNGKAHDGRALKTTLAKMQDALTNAPVDVLEKYKEWLIIETDFQIENEPEELTDELPF